MAKARILHVDDDPDIRLLISASLQDFGYVVATGGTVAEGLELANEFRFDLCILDVPCLMAPELNGANRLINFSVVCPSSINSAYASDEEQEAALSVAGDAYLKKPVLAEVLERTIADLLDRTGDSALASS